MLPECWCEAVKCDPEAAVCDRDDVTFVTTWLPDMPDMPDVA